jgi:hypothetical protein
VRQRVVVDNAAAALEMGEGGVDRDHQPAPVADGRPLPGQNPQNARFLADPIAFCKRTAVNLMIAGGFVVGDALDVNQPYPRMYLDLPPYNPGDRNPKQVIFTPLARKGDKIGLIEGSFFPYLPFGTVAESGLVVLEVPRRNPPTNFLFTGAVNGCSPMLCEKKGDPETVLAIHYPNSDGRAKGYPLLEKDPRVGKTLCEIHFGLYGTDEEPNAFVFFYHKNGTWMGVIQRLAAKRDENRQSMSLREGDKAVGVVAAFMNT